VVHESAYGTTRTSGDVRLDSAKGSKADIAQSPLTYRDLLRGPISAPPRVKVVTRATQRTVYCAPAERVHAPVGPCSASVNVPPCHPDPQKTVKGFTHAARRNVVLRPAR